MADEWKIYLAIGIPCGLVFMFIILFFIVFFCRRLTPPPILEYADEAEQKKRQLEASKSNGETQGSNPNLTSEEEIPIEVTILQGYKRKSTKSGHANAAFSEDKEQSIIRKKHYHPSRAAYAKAKAFTKPSPIQEVDEIGSSNSLARSKESFQSPELHLTTIMDGSPYQRRDKSLEDIREPSTHTVDGVHMEDEQHSAPNFKSFTSLGSLENILRDFPLDKHKDDDSKSHDSKKSMPHDETDHSISSTGEHQQWQHQEETTMPLKDQELQFQEPPAPRVPEFKALGTLMNLAFQASSDKLDNAFSNRNQGFRKSLENIGKGLKASERAAMRREKMVSSAYQNPGFQASSESLDEPILTERVRKSVSKERLTKSAENLHFRSIAATQSSVITDV
ncbi:uncharacterized protein LOC106158474 [Lingula anatina]|uniref:Uncharacterized protein LOC106158474 n=1 Tax=Lingula anatina TaxID=7574 RepID=A0A1S3HV65_LINAN|nr:uncharacterized protein LOC106158474 [Lingula anatina]|eukprot:XP_013389935.1 uncharacterized protein LOC106158474 [Lingula anatina]